ncbi:MAG: RNHCP domain-containing protein [Nocardioides sp.]
MSRTSENTGFRCAHCAARVPPHPGGSYRNHCPACLYSLHVDEIPGDRSAECGGQMPPAGLDYSGKKGFVVIHACRTCGHVDRNKSAPDDDPAALRSLHPMLPPLT